MNEADASVDSESAPTVANARAPSLKRAFMRSSLADGRAPPSSIQSSRNTGRQERQGKRGRQEVFAVWLRQPAPRRLRLQAHRGPPPKFSWRLLPLGALGALLATGTSSG